ncbi:DUF3179 domain-containing (seleno)protein [Sulfitobacter donghicola]|uniref:DUF3179 domain-containing protein n=1 Tax=Sulfitobacter donghicola DSW-25 = KCTC 12864 = JCM 14565 TaxID=1300350 RepID=A0A073IC00_9RHOB|nr:DUF3179 domain-containing (seleno)protein [Sulfitobacter donghicola]KEJ87858.1 hypothetical protein DSW25_04780 [Sulfitobacter donghicola DSW-25 = KCTC 12864 = JCM 14565]KIN60002.1 DUF3179 domain containing protein [Sulfitobacter donghicola DSW-25 = KCTC 12864 = JCM 14565]
MFRHLFTLAIAVCISSNIVWAQERAPLPDYVIAEFGTPPAIPTGPLAEPVVDALEEVLEFAMNQADWNPSNTGGFDTVVQAQDPRLVWAITDMLRFAWRPEFRAALADAAEGILDMSFKSGTQRADIINRLMAWDMPAYPGYLGHKRSVFTNYILGWENIFVEGDIAWHLVDWGGVNIDARPFDATDEVCDCIPAADNPQVSSAAEADWLKDSDIVFGVVINGEARAYPRRIMEVREMVNDTLGGRDIGIPYCTLCGAAQAYFTDHLPRGVERPILRTSGLLIRSNKVMYDLVTQSVFDTFLGKAVTGPLAEIGLQLKPATVITSDWGTWRAAHPETTVLIEDLALGRDFNLRETRDAHGPIFPVGDVDPRLPVHEDVIGAVTSDGTPIAFPRARAMAALTAGQEVVFGDVRLEKYAGGIRALRSDGSDLGSHQSFWFAWSQFHPQTMLWAG